MRYALLHGAWLLALLGGLTCNGVFFQGVIRDERVGDPDIALDLSRPSAQSHRFRPWRGGGWYDVAISSVNHAPPFGTVFNGRVEVALEDGSGTRLMSGILDSTRQHPRPDNMSWTHLDSVMIERSFVRPMTLSARVVDPDPRFAGVTTRVHLRMRQYDPGMGGMVNYVALLPGIIALVVAVGIGANISTRGWGPGPLRVSVALAAFAGLVAMVLRQ